jgi:hypothetical protein
MFKSNFRIILKDNKVQQFDARQGTATRPDPGSQYNDRRVTGSPGAREISMESLILAQDERWRRA